LDFDESLKKKIHPEDDMWNTILVANKGKEISPDNYLEGGRKDGENFRNIVKKYKPSLLSGKRVLDYGCGHGRVTRHISQLFSPSKLVAADVWDSAVNFCANELDATPFLISNVNPISKFDEKFDVIISISVFTHIPPKSFEDNLSALASVLDKDGLLMFTTSGEWLKKRYNLNLDGGYHFGHPPEVKPQPNANKLPNEEYSVMCVSDSFVGEVLDKVGLRIIEKIEKGHVGRQNIFVVEH